MLERSDPEIYKLIKSEEERQSHTLEMIPSENYPSKAVLEALGSILTSKYSEGYPGKRYYAGNQFIDEIEKLAIERAKKLFGVSYVNVQPYSGSPANLAVYLAVCDFGQTIMGQDLLAGGHLTHGWKTNLSGKLFKSVSYSLNEDGYLNLEEVRSLAKKYLPRLIWCGGTAYPREIPFKEFAEIAEEVGAYLVADISHIAGLIAGGVHQSPVFFADIITTTTHKTLRGPRGAIIMVTEKGLRKDPEIIKKIEKAVFPSGCQGGPHNNQTAAIAVALKEAMEPEFKNYARQVVTNAKVLAEELKKRGIKLVSGGTDNHLLLIDLSPFGKGLGIFLQEALELAGITTNKNTVPQEKSSPFYPSGLRLGTPAITTRGMKEEEMKKIASWIEAIIREIKDYSLPEEKERRKEYLEEFRKDIRNREIIYEIKKEVLNLTEDFPIPNLGI